MGLPVFRNIKLENTNWEPVYPNIHPSIRKYKIKRMFNVDKHSR